MTDSTSELNEDVMRLIFTVIGELEPLTYAKTYSGATKDPLGWTRLTHVCRRWREILLGMGELWARDVVAVPGAYDTFLARAAEWPLSISIPAEVVVGGHDKGAIINFVSQHIERVGWLDMRAAHIWPPSLLHNRPLPRLRYLKFIEPPREHGENVYLHAPVLQQAIVPMTPVTLCAPNLTLLALGRLPNPPRLVLETLSSSPLLESLSILFEGLPSLPWDEYTGDPIYLDHLRNVNLKVDSASDMPTFFRLVRWPASARVDIWWKENVGVRDTFDATVDALAPYLHHPTRDTLRLCEENTESGAFAFTLALSASAPAPPGRPAFGTVAFRCYGWLFNFDDFDDMGDPSNYIAVGAKWLASLPHALNRIPVDQIRHFDFAPFPFFPGSFSAIGPLSRFEQATTVCVDTQNTIAADIMERLLAQAHSLPMLKEVTVLIKPGMGERAMSPWWRRVYAALASRVEWNGQLDRLILRGLRRTEDEVEIAAARPLVKELVDHRTPTD